MSRLLSVLTRTKQHIVISKLLNNNLKLSTRLTSNIVKPEVKSELDKPQWERSDRFKIYYGYDEKDEATDKGFAHLFTFLGFFGFIIMPGFLLVFYPDYKTNDWSHREAYLELARREKAGEPLVSPDYVPIEKIKLPSEEELGDMDIVI